MQNDKSSSVIYEKFFPSYPSGLDSAGRYYILTALSRLAVEDRGKWEIAVSKISDGLKNDIKFLKPKHFGKEETDEIAARLDKVNEFIALLFIDLIKETGSLNN